MPSAQITPPTKLDGTAYNTGVDKDGKNLNWSQHTVSYQTSEAVSEGNVLSLVASSATAPVTVKLTDTTDTNTLIIGVALHDAASGEQVNIATDIAYARATASVTAGALVAVDTTQGLCTTEATNVTIPSNAAAGHAFAYALEDDIADYYGSSTYGVLIKILI